MEGVELHWTWIGKIMAVITGKGMLFSVEQAFVGKDEIQAPLKTPAWEVTIYRDPNKSEVLKSCKATVKTNDFEVNILNKFCCT